MDERDRFIAELGREGPGKGWPRLVFVGDRFTTLPSRAIDPKTAREIRKAPGLACCSYLQRAILPDPGIGTMQTFTYPAVLEPGDESGVVVSFPDVPEAITEGDDQADAVAKAAEALGLALLAYARAGRALPVPGKVGGGLVPVTVEAEVAAKLAVLDAFRTAGISKSELARRLGRDEKEVRRILDPMHATKLPALTAALAALGRRLVIGVEVIPAAEAA